MDRTQTLPTMDEAIKPIMVESNVRYNLRSTVANMKRKLAELEATKVEQTPMLIPNKSVASSEGEPSSPKHFGDDKTAVTGNQASEEPPGKRIKVILTHRAYQAPPPPPRKRIKIILTRREAPPPGPRPRIKLVGRLAKKPQRPKVKIVLVGRLAKRD